MDYKKLGFKCGLEIHQQLDTKKLFCECDSIVHDSNPDVFFSRKLTPVAGESGKFDNAAIHEMKKKKTFHYEGCSTSCCLIEMDEEPPRPINKDAVEVALQVSKMLNMKIVDEIQVMRKIVIDGSNVGGFQRTSLIGMNGYIETSKGKVVVDSLCLEEESAKKVKANDDSVTYRLDRLGVPLIEIATDPSIKDPEHAKEVAEKLGMILRSTGKVKRGIGTIRQDVNVSITGSSRVEIKGFQELRSMPKVIDIEIERLKKLKNHESEVRKVNSDNTTTFLRPMPGEARMYPETDVIPFRVDSSKIKIPELIGDKVESLVKKFNIPNDIAKKLVNENIDFEKYLNDNKNIKPNSLVDIIYGLPSIIKKEKNIDVVTLDYFDEVLPKLNDGSISKDSLVEIFSLLSQGKKVDYSKYKPMDKTKLKEIVKNIVSKNKNMPMGAIIGLVMKETNGKADGKLVSQFVREFQK